jgi:transcriptional regulator with XRE-family HTH domain
MDETDDGWDTPEETRPRAQDNAYGAAVCAARRARGWTQMSLAQELGIGETTVNRIESLGHMPYARIQCAIRDLLGVEPPASQRTDALIDATTRYEDDRVCRYVVAHHAPCTLEMVGTLLGVTRERVRQLEMKALAKLAKNANADLRDAIEWLRTRAERGGAEMHEVRR